MNLAFLPFESRRVNDMSGREIMKKENITNNKTELDVSQLKNGIYILVGTDNTGKKLFTERIVAQ